MELVVGKSYKLDIGRIAIVRIINPAANEVWVEFPPTRGMQRFELDLFKGWVKSEVVRFPDKKVWEPVYYTVQEAVA